MLKHADIWRAIDALAEKNGLSSSGLAKKAGLDPTSFNPSKRMAGKHKRWPSTESIASVLRAVDASLDEFVSLASPGNTTLKTIPVLGYARAGREGYFDDAGYPVGNGWDEISSPAISDAHAFALEVSGTSMSPVYREGDVIIISPAEKPRKGDRVAVKTVAGEVMVKQLGREAASKIELVSLNPEFPSMMLPKRDISWIYRVIWASQ